MICTPYQFPTFWFPKAFFNDVGWTIPSSSFEDGAIIVSEPFPFNDIHISI